MKVSAIVPAAGLGRRLKAKGSKALFEIDGKPLLLHTLARLKRCHAFLDIVIAAPARHLREIIQLVDGEKIAKVKVVAGGKTRAESVRNAFLETAPSSEWVLVHDAARPLVSPALCKRLLDGVRETGAAIPVEPVAATVKEADAKNEYVRRTVKRERLFLAQTPQVFRKDLLRQAYRRLGKKAFLATDEAGLFEGSGVRVKLVEGEKQNLKITTPDDVDLYQFYAHRNRV